MLPPSPQSGSQLLDLNAGLERFDALTETIQDTGYFNLYASPDQNASQLLVKPRDRDGISAFTIRQRLHPFQIAIQRDAGIEVINRVGEPLGEYHSQWKLIAHQEYARPNHSCEDVFFDVAKPQRFAMVGDQFLFGESKFSGFGTGRTFPVFGQGPARIAVAGVGIIQTGHGQFQGIDGTYVINGVLDLNEGFSGSILIRTPPPGSPFLVGFKKDYVRKSEKYHLERGSTYLLFRGERKSKESVTNYNLAANGVPNGVNSSEVARQLSLVMPSHDPLQTSFQIGPVLGETKTFVRFDFSKLQTAGGPETPIPYESMNQIFMLDSTGNPLGSINAQVVEGRTFLMKLPKFPQQRSIRFGGIGLAGSGTGVFQGMTGVLSDNSMATISPFSTSSTYLIRLNDPAGVLRAT